jgi:hypothetical protein
MMALMRRAGLPVAVAVGAVATAVLAGDAGPAPEEPAVASEEPAVAVPMRYDQVHPLGPAHQIRVVVDPAQVGTNGVHLFVTDAAGEAADLGGGVELRFRLPEVGSEPITRQPAQVRPGYFLHVGPELSIAGVWEVELRVLASDVEHLTATAEVPVAPAPGGGHDHHHP